MTGILSWGVNGQGHAVTAQLDLMLRLRMTVAVPVIPSLHVTYFVIVKLLSSLAPTFWFLLLLTSFFIQIPPAPPRPDFDASREKLQKLGEGEGTMTKEEFNKMKQELEA